MELRVNVEYDEILEMVRRLPYRVKQRLTSEIEKELQSKNKKEKIDDKELKNFQAFLLKGPVMSDEQFTDFKELRKDFARWLEK